jgi:hypothetical protein
LSTEIGGSNPGAAAALFKGNLHPVINCHRANTKLSRARIPNRAVSNTQISYVQLTGAASRIFFFAM